MERRADLPRSELGRLIGGEANLNLTSSSSSTTSSSLSVSPPDVIGRLNAVFKRHKPLGTMQNGACARRVLVQRPEPSKSSISTTSVADSNDKILPQEIANSGVQTVLNVGFDRKKNSTPQEDSSLTPPPLSGRVTTVGNSSVYPFGMQHREVELLADRGKASLAASSSHLSSALVSSNDYLKKDMFSLADNANLSFQSVDARMTIDSRMDGISSYLHSLALTEGEDQFGNQVHVNDLDIKRHDSPNKGIYGTGESQVAEKREELRHTQQSVDPMTRSTVVGSSCRTTMSVHSGPTYQCTHAPLAGHTGFSTQMSSAIENSLGVSAHVLQEGRGPKLKEGDRNQHHQQSLHMGEGASEKGVSHEKRVSSNASTLQSQIPSTNSKVDMEPSQSNKVEKAPRKKKYDPDVFFKVNGKLYQKLGKIGSGGSSEVHKVISQDCTIYALKKIKLKGRDYPTAYGFCQEIEYLNKLKGKSNIIQLIDYEVTDKTLLQDVMNGSMTLKDGKIKEDQYIYMVLEYGEIDLAHMLSHKRKDLDSSTCKLDDNWLRFYWQQMLEAVNTIHEERIVHSDLKPANFMLVRGSLKLIDFGIAKAISSDTTNIQRDSQVGTLNYMSPEAFMWNEQDSNGNTIKCGRPSDIWSLGCILYQMVYGKTPFAEYKTFWAKFKVITDKSHKIAYEPVSNPLLVDLMKRCLAWERNDRWRIPQLLLHPFLVPPILRELPPPLQCNREDISLLEKINVHMNDPEVCRLWSELREVVANLDRAND